MIYTIPVATESQQLIAALNEGVVPEIEEDITYFLYDTSNTRKNRILTYREFELLCELGIIGPSWTMFCRKPS